MKFLLKYNYNMENPTIYRINNEIYIREKNEKYLLHEIESRAEIDELIQILRKSQMSSQYDNFIKTTFNSNTIIYKNKEYVLIKIPRKKDLQKELLNNLDNTKVISNTLTNYKLDRSNWYFLWCRKNDHIVNHHSHQLGKNAIIDEAIDYYMGLAENAISYLNNSGDLNNNNNNASLYISHKRINPNNYSNPLNVILDQKERDISEYIKYLFFNGKYNEKIMGAILGFIKTKKLSFEKIYARLLYPTYFFDLYEENEEDKHRENEIIALINKIQSYEVFLKNINQNFSRIKAIKKIDWL